MQAGVDGLLRDKTRLSRSVPSASDVAERVVARTLEPPPQEFIRFLNTVEAQVPAGKLIHAVVDNYAPSGAFPAAAPPEPCGASYVGRPAVPDDPARR